MLEFPESFLQHEIREGFYIDATMKTVWATALDLLQTIAEVCEKHDLTWYAAYGTLLGAIRHEGFVPWDDDLDIWMLREDYQKLLELLPGELPEGCHVLSSQTEEGYEQFHTCVVCGEGVSIEPQWLKRHYGCPFRVGVDIFPLDYLPRDRQIRERQKGIFLLTKRIAQLAQECMELAETQQERKNECVKEMEEGLAFLERHCGAFPDWLLLEQEQWGRVISMMYRIANDTVRNCRRQDADELVMYRDFASQEHKIFPKEWFDEAWAATFEHVMLPIPWKYDEVLQRIYGDYHVCRRGGTSHDYPYYEKQLDELRDLIRKQGEIAGKREDEKIFPVGWERLLAGKAGKRKKIVLYTNDISDFIEYGCNALDRLENVLQVFCEAREQILLWWRPEEEMKSALMLADQRLAQRYMDILTQYKTASWGICDESYDKLRAVEQCDAYYGARNTLIDKLVARAKPIMIALPFPEATEERR